MSIQQVDRIIENLKAISEQSGKEFLDLSSNFPVLVSELEFAKKSDFTGEVDYKLAKFIKIEEGLKNAIAKQNDLLERNRQIINNFSMRNRELASSSSESMDILKNMNDLIVKIKDESNEMELISLNAMVVSIKSGQKGQAFSYITSNLKQLSLKLISQADTLIMNEQNINNSIVRLKETIRDVEEISKKTDSITNSDKKGISEIISEIMEQLKHMLSSASEARAPIIKAMECIQMQDIIRQSLDDVILTLTRIKDPATCTTTEAKLDQCCFNEQLSQLSVELLGNINTQLLKSIKIFKRNRDEINRILSEVESERRHFIDSNLKNDPNKESLQNCIERTSKDFSTFANIFSSYQQAQSNVLEKSNDIYHAVQRIQICFNEFFPIITNLQYVAISQRIEVARNSVISSIQSTVDYMTKLIAQTDENVQKAQDILQDFITNNTKQTKKFSKDASMDRKFFSKINKEKLSFLTTLKKLQNSFVEAVNDFTVYSESFMSSYSTIENAIFNLEELSQKLETEQSSLRHVKSDAFKTKEKLMAENGITSWEIKNHSFIDFIKQFTVISDKIAVGNLTGVEVENGVESGEITFF
ncbi:MAG: hypothetical protein J6Y75_03420 [Spirochaetaceae bacterium]|nr:hypothetical protein [Spirochaetaceae bacterium]